ncbi:CGNR zinc finger domain-containing protein [Deinococcus wulumuqiensis]|nr:CGNR zinc finger domain-containing protein [Deinococcus wulumuqiensis]
MSFTRYYETLLGLTERLINSHDVMRQEPESLHTVDDLLALLGDAPFPRPAFRPSDVARVRSIREHLRHLFLDDSLEGALNLALQNVQTRIRVASPGGQGLLAVPAETSASRQVYAASLIGLAWAFEQYGSERFRTCQATPCEDVFVDTTKNGQRRFCGPRCANRAHSRAFRERESVT